MSSIPIGSEVYMPELGDTPEKSGILLYTFGSGWGAMACIGYGLHSFTYPLRYVELVPPKEPVDTAGQVLASIGTIILFSIPVLMFLYGGVSW